MRKNALNDTKKSNDDDPVRNNMRYRNSALNLSIVLVLLIMASCIVSTDDEIDHFSFRHDSSSDTVAPFGTITIVFSEPIADSFPVGFDFSPPHFSFTTVANDRSDTITISLAEPLTGHTRYVLRTAATVESQSGATISPENDSIVLYTYATEREPNDDTATADLLGDRLFASIAQTNDTDCYLLRDSSVTGVFLRSEGSSTILGMPDADNGTLVFREYRKSDTLSVDKTATFPLLITVCAWQKSVGGYYEIGTIKNR